VQRAQGDSTAALTSYQAGLAIAERLAAADPGNTGWQRDVVVSYWKVASLAGPKEERQRLLSTGLDALTKLRDSGQLRDSEEGWIEAFETAIATLE